MKKTITVLGDAGAFFAKGIEILMKQDLRLVFVSEDEMPNSKLRSRLPNTQAVAEVEFTSCERDGCWEADIIVLTQPETISPALLGKIKEVATQKIVMVVNEKKVEHDNSMLQQLLPNSKVVWVLAGYQNKDFAVSGYDPEARERVRELLVGAGQDIPQ